MEDAQIVLERHEQRLKPSIIKSWQIVLNSNLSFYYENILPHEQLYFFKKSKKVNLIRTVDVPINF